MRVIGKEYTDTNPMLAQDLPPPPCQVTGGILIEPPEFVIPALKQKIEALEAQNRLLQQLSEALGDFNRYHASQALGRYATDNEAFIHYVFNGGKQAFDKAHPAG